MGSVAGILNYLFEKYCNVIYSSTSLLFQLLYNHSFLRIVCPFAVSAADAGSVGCLGALAAVFEFVRESGFSRSFVQPASLRHGGSLRRHAVVLEAAALRVAGLAACISRIHVL